MTTTVKGMEISAEETLSKDGLNGLQQDVLFRLIVACSGTIELEGHDKAYYLAKGLGYDPLRSRRQEILEAMESLVEMGRVLKFVEPVKTGIFGKAHDEVRTIGTERYTLALHDADGNPFPFFSDVTRDPVLAAVAVFDSLTYKALGAQKVECDIAEQCRRPKEDVQLLLGLVEQGVDEGLYVVTTQDFLVDVPDSHGGTQPGTCTYYTVQFA